LIFQISTDKILYTISDSGNQRLIRQRKLLLLTAFAKIQSIKGEIVNLSLKDEHFDLIIDCVGKF
jgi:DNA-binding PadR family transcriptional regulator